MFSTIIRIIKKVNPAVIIAIILFIVPFFWLGPGQMDLGGDDNRLFFYDPVSYLKNSVIYDVIIEGKGRIEPNYYDLPYVGFLAILKFFVSSPTILINIVNGIKLAGGFLFIYLIVREFLRKSSATTNRELINAPAILAGIFYVGAFGSFHMAQTWNRALTSHNQIFLNPIIFFFLLKFFLTDKYKYLCTGLVISFVFAPNFGLTSAPPFFAFYPLVLLFLLIYIKFFTKKPISWKGLFFGFILFLGVHAFHLLGQIVSLMDNNSYINNRVFNKELIERGGVDYFSAVSGYAKASLNFLLPSSKQLLQWTGFVAPLIVITGLLFNSKRKELLLIAVFFIVTFFLTTANVTEVGFQLYRNSFYIPGFSMFRNFYTQWLFVFIFFYSLLFGFALHILFSKLKPLYVKSFYLLVFVILVITGIPLFSGDLVSKNIITRGSKNVKTSFIMDPQYEETFRFIKTLPDDGKIMVLPLTDFLYQVIYGKDGGAYEGPSTITHLAGKYNFVGYQHFGYTGHLQYAEDVLKYSREKNYERLLNIFTTLNIRYILHNADPMVYEKGFSPGPYGYMQTSMPKTQAEYGEFLRHFPVRLIYKNGQYNIYELDKSAYNPTIFIPQGVYQSNKLSFDKDRVHSVFIDSGTCNKNELIRLCREEYKPLPAKINFRMINLTFYEVTVRQNGPADTMFLVMQHTFHKGWKLVIDGKNVPENQHILVNGYANGWFLTKKDLPDRQNYTLLIKLDSQKYFWYGWEITIGSLIVVLGLLIVSLRKSNEKNNTVQYVIHVKQSESVFPFLLVFKNSYHKDRKLAIN